MAESLGICPPEGDGDNGIRRHAALARAFEAPYASVAATEAYVQALRGNSPGMSLPADDDNRSRQVEGPNVAGSGVPLMANVVKVLGRLGLHYD